MKRNGWIVLGALVGAVAGAGAAVAAAAAAKPVTMVPADLKWAAIMPDAGTASPMVAPLFGDAKKGPVGFFIKLPAGSPGAMHTHTAGYHAVVISGTITNAADGETAPKAMPAGSYWYQPGKAPHITSCAPSADCVAYIYVEGKFDYFPYPVKPK